VDDSVESVEERVARVGNTVRWLAGLSAVEVVVAVFRLVNDPAALDYLAS
jgi:hypothetical protein